MSAEQVVPRGEDDEHCKPERPDHHIAVLAGPSASRLSSVSRSVRAVATPAAEPWRSRRLFVPTSDSGVIPRVRCSQDMTVADYPKPIPKPSRVASLYRRFYFFASYIVKQYPVSKRRFRHWLNYCFTLHCRELSSPHPFG